MPLLREEAEKLSNNELEQGVIETIIDRDDLFAVLPFMKIDSKAYLYNREATLSEATFIDVNDTITEGAATFTEHVAKLRILAGDVDVDKFLATTMSDTNNQLAVQVRQKVKGLARAFRRNLILGDSSTNTKAFDGIPKLMIDDQKIDIAKAAMTFSMFDELVDAVKDLGADRVGQAGYLDSLTSGMKELASIMNSADGISFANSLGSGLATAIDGLRDLAQWLAKNQELVIGLGKVVAGMVAFRLLRSCSHG